MNTNKEPLEIALNVVSVYEEEPEMEHVKKWEDNFLLNLVYYMSAADQI
jgi:hypothetical protein